MSAPCSHVQVHQTLLTEVAFVGVESDRKAMNVTDGISRATATGNSGEAYKNRGLFGWRVQKRSSSYVRPISIGREHAVCSRATSMYSTLWYSLMICKLCQHISRTVRSSTNQNA
jgi:hypothetical protein